jgi:hypothetical protein
MFTGSRPGMCSGGTAFCTGERNQRETQRDGDARTMKTLLNAPLHA